jgi:integrase/recombinase XerD
MPVSLWPEQDRLAWQEAICPRDIFDVDANVSADWSLARRRIVVMSYGYWLTWLRDNSLLDPTQPPGDRAAAPLVSEFVHDLRQRLAPSSVVMFVGGLKRLLEMIAPAHDWQWMRPLYRNLKRAVVPTREKHTRIVPSGALFELGRRLMEEAYRLPIERRSTLVQARDGLMIAMLASRPIRIGNFGAIEIGPHLTENGGLYRAAFRPEETKVGRSIDFHYPDALTPHIARYLEVYRPLLLKGAKSETRRLWIAQGDPMVPGSIYFQIRRRTKEAFGHRINPYLFRDCAATSIAIEDPEHVRIAAMILGHTSLSTTEKHHNQARMLTAARARNSEITKLRRNARSWGSRSRRERKG